MGGVFDLNAHEGRLMARQLVAIASNESGHKADRIRRANRTKVERGDWHGPPRFGYGIGGVLIPEQAVIVREMADRFLARPRCGQRGSRSGRSRRNGRS